MQGMQASLQPASAFQEAGTRRQKSGLARLLSLLLLIAAAQGSGRNRNDIDREHAVHGPVHPSAHTTAAPQCHSAAVPIVAGTAMALDKRKVAVCITGRLDLLPITADNLRRNVFEALGPQTEVDVDVFVYSYTHTYDERDSAAGHRSDRYSRYLEFLNPVDVIMEADKERLDESGFRYCTQWAKTGVKACAEGQVQIMYGLHRANAMRKKREEAQGFSYDWVVRLRTDVLFSQKIPPLTAYPMDRLTVPAFHNDRPGCHECLNDRFAIGPSHVMDVLLDQYVHESRARQRCHFAEFHLYAYLQERGLEDWV